MVAVCPLATSITGRDVPDDSAIVPPCSRYPFAVNESPPAPTPPDTTTVPADPPNTARDPGLGASRPEPFTHRIPVPLPPTPVPDAAADQST